MTTTDGRSIRGTFLTPTVNGDSHLPALLGLKALRENGAILNTQDLTLAFCGKEKPKIEYPSGTEIFQLLMCTIRTPDAALFRLSEQKG